VLAVYRELTLQIPGRPGGTREQERARDVA
jgi:hypothetical protein